MAFVIFSAGPVTHSRLRTVDALPLATGVALVLLLIMIGCFALGYGSAHTGVAQRPPDRTAVRLDLDRPEGRALIDRVGVLSGRLTLLESEAATLATRLGVGRPAAVRPAARPQRHEPALTAPDTPARARPIRCRAAARSSPSAVTPRGQPESAPNAAITARACLDSRMNSRGSKRWSRSWPTSPSRTIWRAWPFPTDGPSAQDGRARVSAFVATRSRADRPATKASTFAAPVGTPILASAGGRVVAAGPSGAYGNAVVIDHGNGLATLYGHASRVFVRPGDLVMPQQAIAAVGSTGRSTGAHLHFEVMRRGIRVEPRDYLAHVDAPSGLP